MRAAARVYQPESATVRFERMDEVARWHAPLVGAAKVLRNRFLQRFNTWVVRMGARKVAEGPEALAKFMAMARRRHDVQDGPGVLARVDAEAVREVGPGEGLPLPPVPSEWFAPRDEAPNGFVFYVHGGSFVAQRSPRITQLVAKFAAAAGARVFAPNYRLAPEHACPAAVEDVVEAFRWFRRTWPDEPVVALAESAGAAILLAALQQLRDAGEAPPDGVVLLSPWVDLSLQSWSVIAASLAGTTPYTMETLAIMAQLYLQGRPATDPIASPLFGTFDGFPPMLIHASQDDILYDDAVRLAEKVRDVGGDLTVRLWTAETHVWERTSSPKAKQSIELASDFIRRRLDTARPRV